MDKDEFLKIISPMFDSSAHYNGTGSRTFTNSEVADFFEKAYVLFHENNTNLTFALLKTNGKPKCFQDQAEHIVSLL